MSVSRNTEPTLTVGLPTFNCRETVAEALDSLLLQSFRDFVVLVSDNASTDDTWLLLSEYASRDSRIQLHRQKNNIGAGRNFLWLAERARTPYFTWLGADDSISEHWLGELLQMAQTKNGAVFGQIQQVDTMGRTLSLPASAREMRFTGPRIVRQLNYLLEPAICGRANLVYSIMRREDAITAAKSLASGDHGDQLALFKLLRRTEINSVQNVWLRKRISVDFDAVNRENPRPKWSTLIAVAWTSTFSREIFREADKGERILVVIASPVVLCRSLLVLLRSYTFRGVVFNSR